jgi:hypothetical protein
MQSQAIFNIVYLVAFLSYLLLSLFILYHIIRYTGNKTVMLFTIIFFLIGTTLLLLVNASFFFSIPFDQIMPTFTMPSSPPKSIF